MHRTSDAIVCILNEQDPARRIVLRMAGNNNLLAEFGELSLDIRYRVRVYWLEKILLEMNVKGLLELSPGVRSTLITYDSMTLPLNRLVEVIKMAEAGIDAREPQAIPSRTVRLPIAFYTFCLVNE
jgi:urea carboxylase